MICVHHCRSAIKKIVLIYYIHLCHHKPLQNLLSDFWKIYSMILCRFNLKRHFVAFPFWNSSLTISSNFASFSVAIILPEPLEKPRNAQRKNNKIFHRNADAFRTNANLCSIFITLFGWFPICLFAHAFHALDIIRRSVLAHFIIFFAHFLNLLFFVPHPEIDP